MVRSIDANADSENSRGTDKMRIKSIFSRIVIPVLFLFSAATLADTAGIEREGTRDGKTYAQDLEKNGIKVDATACAVGMAAEDSSRPHYTQAEIEAYAKAFGNACMGRQVF